jgi:hypothetical protein
LESFKYIGLGVVRRRDYGCVSAHDRVSG